MIGLGTATRYLYGPGNLPLARITATGQLSWYHADHLGSTRLLTDAAGAVTATYAYDPYGTLTAATGAAMTQPLRYAGEYTDAESGLLYLRARYYDPATGQSSIATPWSMRRESLTGTPATTR